MTPAMYAKAIIGALVAGLTALATALDESGVTGAEWAGIAVTTLSTFAGVYAVPNAARRLSRGDVGRADPLYVLAVVFVVVLIVAFVSWLIP